jgi:hypothetical protein
MGQSSLLRACQAPNKPSTATIIAARDGARLEVSNQLASRQPVEGSNRSRASSCKLNGIALAFHRKAQYSARQFVRPHGPVAERFERQSRFIESRL